MIKRALRLPMKSNAVRGGGVFSSAYFLMKSSPNKLTHNRYGAIIGGSVSKSSTFRHAMKREVFAVVENWPAAREGRGYDILFIISPRIAQLPTRDARLTIRESLSKAEGKFFK